MYNAIAEMSQKPRSLQPSSIVYVNKETSQLQMTAKPAT